MKNLIWLAALVAGLSGCAAIPDAVDTVTGSANQKVSSGPLYKYRADLKISFPGSSYVYRGVTAALVTGPIDINIQSLVNIDRIQVTTCARQNVCEKNGDCPSGAFTLEDGWFGQAGKNATYHFSPTKKELEGYTCPLYIEVFSSNSLVSWGMIGIRTDENLLGHLSCNGEAQKFAGVDVCQSKGGLDQQIWFDTDIVEFEAEPICHATKTDSKTFNVRPDNGICRATFFDGTNWNRAIFIGYDSVLVRSN